MVIINIKPADLGQLVHLPVGNIANLEERVQPEKDIHEFLQDITLQRRLDLEYHAFLNFAELYTVVKLLKAYGSDEFAAAFTVVVGGLTILMHGGYTFNLLERYVDAKSQNQKAKEMSEQGFVFADELKKCNLLPSNVDTIEGIHVHSVNQTTPNAEPKPITLYAIKEKPVTPVQVRLSELLYHTGKPVVLKTKLTTAPRTEEARMTGDISLDLQLFLFSGTAKGTVDGKVYVPVPPFRIGEGDTTYSAGFTYLPFEAIKDGLPVEIRQHSRQLQRSGPSDRNQLIHFLNEVCNMRKDVLLYGKADPNGTFHVEAVANPNNGQAFTLAVYQPTKNLKMV